MSVRLTHRYTIELDQQQIALLERCQLGRSVRQTILAALAHYDICRSGRATEIAAQKALR